MCAFGRSVLLSAVLVRMSGAAVAREITHGQEAFGLRYRCALTSPGGVCCVRCCGVRIPGAVDSDFLMAARAAFRVR